MTRTLVARWYQSLVRVPWRWWVVGGILLAGGLLLGFDMCKRHEEGKRERRQCANRSSLLLGRRTFNDLHVIVWASELQGNITANVQLYRPRATASRCFIAPPDLRISMNGIEMSQRSSGGRKAGERLMGFPMPFTSCKPVVYGLDLTRELASKTRGASVLVESGRRCGEVRINTLFEPRGAVFEPRLKEVTPGDRVSMKWTHADDSWEGNIRSSYVWMHSEKGTATVDENRGLVFKDGRFDFAFPEVPPGPTKVTVALTDLVAHPVIDTCEGFGACFAKSRISIAKQEVNVLPRLGPLRTDG